MNFEGVHLWHAGMNKMVINHLEKLFVTSDASTIINELEVEHPAAKLLVLAAQAQHQEIGDGTNFVSSHTAELWTIKPFQLFSTFILSLFIRVLCRFYFFLHIHLYNIDPWGCCWLSNRSLIDP